MAKQPTVEVSPIPDPAPTPRKQIRVIGPKAGRRRAGFVFGPEPVVLTELDITEDQARMLASDPELMIVAEDYEATPPPAPAPADPSSAA